jgi:hypothetical protein
LRSGVADIDDRQPDVAQHRKDTTVDGVTGGKQTLSIRSTMAEPLDHRPNGGFGDRPSDRRLPEHAACDTAHVCDR